MVGSESDLQHTHSRSPGGPLHLFRVCPWMPPRTEQHIQPVIMAALTAAHQHLGWFPLTGPCKDGLTPSSATESTGSAGSLLPFPANNDWMSRRAMVHHPAGTRNLKSAASQWQTDCADTRCPAMTVTSTNSPSHNTPQRFVVVFSAGQSAALSVWNYEGSLTLSGF